MEKTVEPTTVPGDVILVTWDGDHDPANPKNWPLHRKWLITMISSVGGLICLMISTSASASAPQRRVLAPALETIASGMSVSQTRANMTLSIFVLAFAFGPMFLAPMAELFGRRNSWLICSAWFCIWNLICGFAHNNGTLLAARLLAGIGSSVEYVIGLPLLGDLWRPEQRGMSFAIATALPLLGPALGPLLGGVITGSLGYRWIFWIVSIWDAALITLAFLVWPETYEPLLLHRKAQRLAKETNTPHRTAYDIHSQPLSAKLNVAMRRPFLMLLQQPIIQMMAPMMAFNFGTLYFVLTSYASLWTNDYHESVTISGMHYIALCIGYILAAQGGGRVTDYIWRRLKEKSGGETAPEYRVPLMLPGILLMPAGLVWFGWAAQGHAHWALVDAGGAVFGFGVILSTQAMQQYVMECYKDHVGSAAAATQFLRSIFAFCFPLFAPSLYKSLGYGWGNTTLALVFCAVGIPGPFLLWFFGAKLRAKGAVVK